MSTEIGVALPHFFYVQDTLTVAQALLGCVLVHDSPQGRTSGMIVETEAYLHNDPASHAFGGQMKRNAAMFGPPGHAYIYFIYGRYHCLNVVTQAEGVAEAVLIRAVEPLDGIELMQVRRPGCRLGQLTNGPAKLVTAFAIPPLLNGHDLRRSPLWIEPRVPRAVVQVVATPRIGISRGREELWRFAIRGNTWVSRPT